MSFIAGNIQIGQDHLQCSFSILEEQPMDMLLGLDMLKRHQVFKLNLDTPLTITHRPIVCLWTCWNFLLPH